MPDRALVRLDELLSSLSTDLAGSRGLDRQRCEANLVWCQVERGELGEAFRILWEAAESPGLGTTRLVTRAELQAYCGNEDAALALIAQLGTETADVSMVRARVAASRGDWDLAFRCATESSDASNAARALALAARASAELGRWKSASHLLDRVAPANFMEELQVAGLRALCSGDDAVDQLRQVVHRASQAGAMRTCAESWADLSVRHRSNGQTEAMRNAGIRAVEIWDDMATTLPPPLRGGFWSDARRQSIRKTSKRPSPGFSIPAKNTLPALLHNLRRLASERDLSKLLTLVTDGAVALCGAERGFVLLVDEGGALEARTIRNAEAQVGEQTAAFSRSIAETVLIDGDPVVTVDAAHDVRVQDYLSVHQLMLKSVACLPIQSHGRMWGVLYLEHRSASGRFSGTDLSVLRAYADQAAIAIETSELFERIELQKLDLERANAALREANEHLEQRVLGQAESLQRTRREIAALQASSSSEGQRWGLVGASDAMCRVYDVLDRVAANEVPVVLIGESGTGKELVARAIHRGSARAEAPYVSLHCGAIPEDLLESELFGHMPGAFTGATRARDGLFAQAHRGTLLLDEIADMPARMQLDLLRVLQEGRVRPVGGTDEKAVDVRLVTASKRPLKELIAEGKLREDLYYRLAVVELSLPPLRARQTDIPLLADHFLRRIAEERSEPKKRLSRSALQRLLAHDFPGNVRELEHLLVNATVFAVGDTIETEELAIESDQAAAAPNADAANYRDFKESERDRILATLNAHGWNRAKAARALGMARRTFYRRLKEHGIDLPSGKGAKL